MNASEQITVYEPYYRSRTGWLKTWLILIRNIFNSKELIWQLFRRDFLMQYKKSFLGATWLIVTPLVGVVSWVLFNATGILQPGDVGIPYPAYVLLSTSIFSLWPSLQTAAAGTLEAGKGFIDQVNYPHETLLIKQALVQLATFGIVFAINMLVLIGFGVIVSWKIVFFPFMILPIFFISAAVGLQLSLIGVVAPDIKKGVLLFSGLVMYITPVVFSSRIKNPLIQEVMKYNPLTYLVGGFRDVLIYGKMQHVDLYFIISGVCLLLFLISWRMFYLAEEKVIEKMI